MAEHKSFSSNIGAIMAAVGSAVGLGNIWRFPYICGQYGGGAFLLVYLIFVFCIGMVLMMCEFAIGRRTQSSPAKAFTTLYPKHKGWRTAGVIGIVACFFIVSQYSVVSGWTLNYFVDACTGTIAQLGLDSQAIDQHFDTFSSSMWKPIIFLAIFLGITTLVILGGVQKGIERMSKILMPGLLILIIVLCIKSVSMPGAAKGLQYLFQPDFSKLTADGVLAALGQALFSLSVGMGVMIVYGSYIPQKDNLFRTSLWITASDTLIAILAGIAIFPAVFSCGYEPTEGPGLVFIVLPEVFNTMDGFMGTLFASLFFLLLFIAALTSSISLLEGLTAWFTDSSKQSRIRCILKSAIATALFAIAISLSNGIWKGYTLFGNTLFDLIDKLNSIYLLPICALLTVIFAAWVIPDATMRDELSNHGTLKIGYYRMFRFVARYIAPIALVTILVCSIIQ